MGVAFRKLAGMELPADAVWWCVAVVAAVVVVVLVAALCRLRAKPDAGPMPAAVDDDGVPDDGGLDDAGQPSGGADGGQAGFTDAVAVEEDGIPAGAGSQAGFAKADAGGGCAREEQPPEEEAAPAPFPENPVELETENPVGSEAENPAEIGAENPAEVEVESPVEAEPENPVEAEPEIPNEEEPERPAEVDAESAVDEEPESPDEEASRAAPGQPGRVSKRRAIAFIPPLPCYDADEDRALNEDLERAREEFRKFRESL